MSNFKHTFTLLFAIILILSPGVMHVQAQTKTSTLHTIGGKIVFDNARVYLMRDDMPADYPFVILDLSMDNGQGDFMIGDSVYLSSTKTYHILNTGIRYELPDAPIEKVSVVKQYKVIIRDTITAPIQRPLPSTLVLEAITDSTDWISFPQSVDVKHRKKEVKRTLEQLITQADSNSFVHGMNVKGLYKQKRGKCSNCINWSIELDRAFICIQYDTSQSDGPPLVLELVQISRP